MISDRVKRVNAAVKLQFCLAELNSGTAGRPRAAPPVPEQGGVRDGDVWEIFDTLATLRNTTFTSPSSPHLPRPPLPRVRPQTANSPERHIRRDKVMRRMVQGRMYEVASDRQHWLGFQRHVGRCRSERVQSARKHAVERADIIQRNMSAASTTPAVAQTHRALAVTRRVASADRAKKSTLLKQIADHNTRDPLHAISTLASTRVHPGVKWTVFYELAKGTNLWLQALQKKRVADRGKEAAQRLIKTRRKIGMLLTSSRAPAPVAPPVQETEETIDDEVSVPPEEKQTRRYLLEFLPALLQNAPKEYSTQWGVPIFVATFVVKTKIRVMCTRLSDAYLTYKRFRDWNLLVKNAGQHIRRVRMCQRIVRRFLRSTRSILMLWVLHFDKIEERQRLLHRYQRISDSGDLTSDLLQGEFLLTKAIPSPTKLLALRRALQHLRKKYALASWGATSPGAGGAHHCSAGETVQRNVLFTLKRSRLPMQHLLSDAEMTVIVTDCLHRSMKRFVRTQITTARMALGSRVAKPKEER